MAEAVDTNETKEHRMKTIAWVAALVVLVAVPTSAQAGNAPPPPPVAQVTAGPLDSAAWDYGDADLTTYQVTRFELCVDGALTGCATVEPATGKFTPVDPPAAGMSAYKVKLPAMTPGAHTISVRACNASACSDPTPLVSFKMQIKPPAAIWRGFVSGGEDR